MGNKKPPPEPPSSPPQPATPGPGQFVLQTPLRVEGVGGPPLASADAPSALQVFGKDIQLRLAPNKKVYVLGSAPRSEIDLSLRIDGIEDPNSISRVHAIITRDGNWLKVADHKSLNGTFFNDVRVESLHIPVGGKFRVDVVELIALDDRLIDVRPTLHRFLGYADYRAVDQACQVIAGSGPVVIDGPRGSEHEILAKAIHVASVRHDRPFVTLALKDPVPEQTGKVARARRGTVFVDTTTGTLTRQLIDLLLNPDFGLRPIFATSDQNALKRKLDTQEALATIKVPPVASRPQDVPHLFNGLFVEAQSPHVVEELKADRLAAVCAHEWPENLAGVRKSAPRLLAYLANKRNVAAAARAFGITAPSMYEFLERFGAIEPES
jgi:hypothetical protein